MIASLMTLTVAALVGAVPPEAAWLGSLPADVQAVAWVRGVEAARDDVAAMVGAMGPDLDRAIRPELDRAIAGFTGRFGAAAARSPLFILVGRARPGGDGIPPIALVARPDDVEGLRRALSGGEPQASPRDGGYEALAGAGGTSYVASGPGFVAFGTDEELIAAVAKRGGDSLDSVMTDDQRERLFAGDVGLFVNLAAFRVGRGEEIEQLRRSARVLFSQLGDDGFAECAAIVYDRVHDELIQTRGVALGVDFHANGLDVAGATRAVAGSDLERRLPGARPGDPEALATLPVGSAHYRYLSGEADDVSWMERLVLAFVGRRVTPDDAKFAEILEHYRRAGHIELINATTSRGGFGWIYLPTPENPTEMVAAMGGVLEAMKGDARGGFGADVVMERAAVVHRGFTLNHARVAFDYAKLAGGDASAAASMRSFFGGDSMDEWFGTDGTRVLSVIAHDWDEARARIDAALAGEGAIGATPSYRAVRSRLPARVNDLTLISVRELLGLPPDPSADPGFIGVALTGAPDGREFRIAVPREIGPIVEPSLVPLLEGLLAPATP
ncbi:hypothetical protein [Paludisphaera soli]|uniref:hypothetical protein n=1 Tax=Paludisphaera soli TaxID=2712865 RepID=UPI0013EDE3AE|nr:hypothetical protein [Paludisphaera soli]